MRSSIFVCSLNEINDFLSKIYKDYILLITPNNSYNMCTKFSEQISNSVTNKLVSTINDFADEVAKLYKVDSSKIIDIWNRVCPDIEIKNLRAKLEDKKTKPSEEVKLEDKPSKEEEEDGIVGPDEDKVYTKDDVMDAIVKLLKDGKLTKDHIKADVDNYKYIKKQLKTKDFEVSKSVIKKIIKTSTNVIMINFMNELKYKKTYKFDELEEFNPDEE